MACVAVAVVVPAAGAGPPGASTAPAGGPVDRRRGPDEGPRSRGGSAPRRWEARRAGRPAAGRRGDGGGAGEGVTGTGSRGAEKPGAQGGGRPGRGKGSDGNGSGQRAGNGTGKPGRGRRGDAVAGRGVAAPASGTVRLEARSGGERLRDSGPGGRARPGAGPHRPDARRSAPATNSPASPSDPTASGR